MTCNKCQYWFEDEKTCMFGEEGKCVDDYEWEPDFRYAVVYDGCYFEGDEDGWNDFLTNSYDEAMQWYYTFHSFGMKVYVKDIEYGVFFEEGEWS